ncbi:DUF4249 domain-containing protein [Aquimarina sp. AD10]|uniref:DUF4249 domain-containing protein n=2 Tax=Flavobacteriaceae TaxID=49546 RepID=A0A162XI14_9FLAO|nr:DUF4249 domain-containing protein [Aquimarina sp. AD10]KZS38649.1 hypothetical protein AWE51_13720 [Aquimarina aggregata]RKM92999.1 DUF4249 domain-containing protein [Aquimarina sp. AD10]
MMRCIKKIERYRKLTKVLALVFIGMISSRCVETFEVESQDFESILVINTTITNEMKFQQILLSRTFKFEEDKAQAEQGATIKIIEDSTVEYIFEEPSPGVYRSAQEFKALPNKGYRLSIETLEGKSYTTEELFLPQETAIDDVRPVKMFNSDGVGGVGILIDAFDPSGNSKYYRYEFEETYRISAPFWVGQDLVSTVEAGETIFSRVDRPSSERQCYNGGKSNTIITTNTTALSEDRLDGFLVHFIKSDDIRVADRYSIFIRQYVQSRDANGFYETLDSFSDSESIFSQIQPGFISSNIVSNENPDEKVLGFFDVSSVSEKRIFFNRDEVIGDLPRFTLNCAFVAPEQEDFETAEAFRRRIATDFIRSGGFKFFKEDPPMSGDFVFVPRSCGDCSVFGRGVAPDFWIE